MTDGEKATEQRWASARGRNAWALYDWAGDGFSAVIIAYVFSAYFIRSVAEDSATGTSQWGAALAIAGIVTGLTGPIAGAIADRSGGVKPWLFVATLLCAIPTAALWFVTPEVGSVTLALVLVGLASYGMELSKVFYNSMLPRLVPPERIGRLSGFAWSLGYFGGIAALGLALIFVMGGDLPFFAFDRDASEHVRISGPIAALWLLIFAAPLFLYTPDQRSKGLSYGAAIKSGFAQLRETFESIRRYGNLLRFLLARLVYIDGAATLFAFGGVYAAGTFGMTVTEVLIFGIALNITGGVGAFIGGWVDDTIGPRRTILIGLVGVIACGIPLLLVEGKWMLWACALPLGFFLGPIQAAGRSFMARLAPEGMETQMFGFFAFSGKITAFIGPALVAWITAMSGNQRAGMSVIVALFALGAVLLLWVRDPEPQDRAAE